MTFTLFTSKMANFLNVVNLESELCNNVVSGKKVQCPYCGRILYYIDKDSLNGENPITGVYCSNNDFKRYISSELKELRGHELLRIGDVLITAYLKTDNKDKTINIDYIENYNNDKITYRRNIYRDHADSNASKLVMSDLMFVKIKDIEWIGIRRIS